MQVGTNETAPRVWGNERPTVKIMNSRLPLGQKTTNVQMIKTVLFFVVFLVNENGWR
jgi:hypothetical protein